MIVSRTYIEPEKRGALIGYNIAVLLIQHFEKLLLHRDVKTVQKLLSFQLIEVNLSSVYSWHLNLKVLQRTNNESFVEFLFLLEKHVDHFIHASEALINR